jgi:hypothetical protein
MKFIWSIVCLVAFASVSLADNIAQQVQDCQVTIKAGDYYGSGALITTKDKTTWVLTCGHLFAHTRTEREIYENGNKKTLVEFGIPKVYKILSDGKQDIGKMELSADVVRYSDANYGQDLALLKIRKKGLLTQNIKFYLEDEPPPVETELYHCGSLQGDFGANSITTGIISKIGRMYNPEKGVERVYDQTSVTAFPGSSGGPVCLKKDGRYVGCLTRGSGETFNLMVPIRRIREWAKEADIEFILDPTKSVPTDEQLKKSPIEPHAPVSK